jgi:proline iminopeptidase
MVALQHLVDAPGATLATVVSHGVGSAAWFAGLPEALTAFEPADLRAQVAASWAAEETVSTRAEFAQLMRDQAPFHFADPRSPLIADYQRRTVGTAYGPEVLRAMAPDYGAIEVVDRLGTVTQPVLVLAGRHDRVCPVGAAEQMAGALPAAALHIFEQSGHMSFVEQNQEYLAVVREFLRTAEHR